VKCSKGKLLSHVEGLHWSVRGLQIEAVDADRVKMPCDVLSLEL